MTITVFSPSALATTGADAGVASRSLHDHAAGPEFAAGNGVLDDEQGCAVLDRLAGIHEFGLAENLAAGGSESG
jgi:hypothetical protein